MTGESTQDGLHTRMTWLQNTFTIKKTLRTVIPEKLETEEVSKSWAAIAMLWQCLSDSCQEGTYMELDRLAGR